MYYQQRPVREIRGFQDPMNWHWYLIGKALDVQRVLFDRAIAFAQNVVKPPITIVVLKPENGRVS